MLAGRERLRSAFALPTPVPPIHADLNGLVLLAVGIGCVWPCRDPDRYRGYLWVVGPRFARRIPALRDYGRDPRALDAVGVAAGAGEKARLRK
jgi:hypothetical protein